MFAKQAFVAITLLTGLVGANAQGTNQVQLKIEPSNRTLTVTADARVTADPEFAILHIGFESQPLDAKAAYAAGAKTSNDIFAALKQAGIAESSIRSERLHLNSFDSKGHKFKLVQAWTVETPPERVAEILDVAVSAGASDSGKIDWTIKDLPALQDRALEQATTRAKSIASALAKGMGVSLGKLIYVTTQASTPSFQTVGYSSSVIGPAEQYITAPRALSIEPKKVSREASVYAVFAIE
jgi:uncharacterized protein YggE